MSTIRKQSIISSIIVYCGFALGFLNTYLFTREGSGLTKEQFGLTNTFIAIANIMYSIASFGMPAYIAKFFPYYKAHLPGKKNDQLTWALASSLAGFLLVTIIGILLKPILIDKVFANSPELPKYYYWIFIFGLGFTLYMIMEAYALQQRKAVMNSFLKEVLFRFFTTVLIVLTSFQVITNFDVFIGFYSIGYLVLVAVVFIYFISKHQLYLATTISTVTRKFYKKILQLVAFFWGGSLVFNVASVFDTIVIAAVMPNGMAFAGIYSLAQNISSLIQAPQRAIISASVGPLSQAWREKNLRKINTIYHRSSINQLIFSCAMFCLIWMNFEDGIYTFDIQGDFLQAKWVFFYIGLYKIIDMGTGLNAQIIGTSNFWRFEFVSGIILLSLMLPLNLLLTHIYGIMGPAISNLIGFTIYNLIRYSFLYRKFKMQPFTIQTVYTLLLTAIAYYTCYFLFDSYQGIEWIILRSTVFCLLFAVGLFGLKLSPDLQPVLAALKKRLGK